MKKFIFGVGISAIFLFLLFRQLDLKDIQAHLLKANLWFVLFAVAVHFVGFYIRALRWGKLLESVPGYPGVSSRQLFKITTLGYMFNNILPLRLGDVAKTFLFAQEYRLSRSSVLATVFMEKIADGLALLAIMGVALFFIPLPPWLQTSFYLVSTVFLLPPLVMLLIVTQKSRFPLKWLERLPLATRLVPLLRNFWQGLGAEKSFSTLVTVFVWSLLIWIIEGMMVLLIGHSLALPLGPFQAIVVTAITNLAITIPSAPGYVGPFEFFMTQSAVLFGVDVAHAASFAILTHIAQWLPITLLGCIISFWNQHVFQVLRKVSVDRSST